MAGEDVMTPALDALREGLFTCDALGCVTYANPALRALLDLESPEELVGGHWRVLFAEESWRRVEREGLPALLDHGHWQNAVELRRRDGERRAVSLSLSAVERGGLVGLVRSPETAAAALDLERLLGEARSERLEALRRLAGDMGHDLNNVLASILGYARFLTEDLPKDGQPHSFAEQIVEATHRAKRTIDEALAFARPGRGARQALAVAAVIDRAAGQLRATLPPGSTVRVTAGGGDLAVETVPGAFADVADRVLANAAEALEGEAGVIEVAWRATGDLRQLPGLGKPGEPPRVAIELLEGGRRLAASGTPDPNRRYLELLVRDSGSGIAPEVMEHIFEPYYTTRKPSKGRGLGLATVFGQALGHGGAVLVDSGPGLGTTVKLYWPLAVAVEATKTPANNARRQLPRGQGQRILVAEDDRVLREALGEMLQRLGYRPVLVNDGAVARQVLAEGSRVEAVLTDRRMPNLSGTELIEWMRAQGLAQPVLLCTGYGEDLDAAGLSRNGEVALLSKPVDAATLARSLERLLAEGVA